MDLSKHAEFIGAHGFECTVFESEDAIIVLNTSWNPETNESFHSILHYTEEGITETMVGSGDTENYHGGDYENTRAFLGY